MSQNANMSSPSLAGLLGIPAPTGSAAATGQFGGAVGETNSGANAFGDILGLLTGANNAPILVGATSNGDKSANIGSQVAGALMLNGLGLQQLLALNPQGNVLSNQTLPGDSLPGALSAASLARPEFDRQINQMIAVGTQWPSSPLSALPASLANRLFMSADGPSVVGTWEVVKSQVSDGLLKLELRSKTDPNQLLKLSVPVAALENSFTQSVSLFNAQSAASEQTNRIALVPNQSGSTKLDQLFSKVQLTELVIENQPVSSAAAQPIPDAKMPLQLTLAGTNNGMPFTLNGAVASNQVKSQVVLSTSWAQPPASAASVVPAQSASVLNADATQAPGRMSAKPVATDLLLSSSQDKQAGNDQDFSSDDFMKFAPDRSLSMSKLQDSGLKATAVRFTLPENLAETVKSGVKSVMLKIEPEHLGPARLNLVMNQDTLSARVIVDTPQAKFAVQNSIDQLTDQLARAGIRLDHIEVSLQGGGAHNQFFHRPTDWFRSHRQTPAFAADDLPSQVSAPRAVIPPAANYVTSSGVNLYA